MRPLPHLADAIIVLWGWRRLAAAVAAGAVSALAMPPFSFFPVLWLTIPVLVFLLDGAVPSERAGTLRRLVPAAIVGWAFGFGYFLAGLWWIGAAFLVDADKFAWLLPVAVLALPAGLAAFWGLGGALARIVWPEGWPRILIFAVAFSAAEWLRGHVLTGFPWNAFGYALTPVPAMMQSASLVGLWGLTLAAFVIFAAPALLAAPERDGRRGRALFAAGAACLLVAHAGFGAVRLYLSDSSSDPAVRIRIVQPSIEQSEKWQSENEDAIFRRYLELSDASVSPEWSGVDAVTHLVWPESALPFFLVDRPDALAAIAALLPEGTTLLTGAARTERVGAAAEETFNSIYAIDDKGEILSTYDKVHLVPFGEFLPFQTTLESLGLRQLTSLPGGFSAGTKRRTLAVPGAPPVGPLICYEIVFPGAVTETGARPGWLLNLTNDAWFGDTPGPRQHFLQARLRAVEEGLPLVRAANSGISAIVDPYGRIVENLDVERAGVVDGELPLSLPPTVFALFGVWVFPGLAAAALLVATIGRGWRKNSHN